MDVFQAITYAMILRFRHDFVGDDSLCTECGAEPIGVMHWTVDELKKTMKATWEASRRR